MESGTFGLLMRLTRIAGMAPYPWGCNGHHLLTKILVVLYGHILITATGVSVIISDTLTILASRNPLKVFRVMQILLDILIVIIITIGNYTSQRRMGRMTKIIKQLEQIELKFSCYQTNPDEITRRTLNKYFISYMIGCAVLRVIRCINLYNIGIGISKLVQYMIKQYFVVALEMQLTAFAGRILITLKILNENLKNLLPHSIPNTTNELRVKRIVAWEEPASSPQNIYDDLNNTNVNIALHQFNARSVEINEEEGIEYKIRRLATSYMNILDIIEEWIKAEGLPIIMILIYHMLSFEWVSFEVIEDMIASKNGLELAVAFNACIIGIHVVGTILFIEPFHRTHVEVDRTEHLVQFLKDFKSESVPITNELELFMRVLVLQRISYSPLDIVTLNRSLILKIFSSLVTYLLINLTYGASENYS